MGRVSEGLLFMAQSLSLSLSLSLLFSRLLLLLGFWEGK